MAINKGRIAAGPTTTRVDAKTNCVKITNTVPPSGYFTINEETGIVEYVDQTPQREGQMLAYSAQNEVTMYVAVNISGTLTWVRCAAIAGYINSTTGKPFGL